MAPPSLTGLVVFLCLSTLLSLHLIEARGRGRGQIKTIQPPSPNQAVDEAENFEEEGSHRQGRRKLTLVSSSQIE